MDINILVYGFPLVLIIIGIVQIVKKFVDNSKWYPVVSVLVGMALASLAVYSFWTPEALIKGLVAGLVASGLWSGGKTVLGK